jgi:hypothetical protein
MTQFGPGIAITHGSFGYFPLVCTSDTAVTYTMGENTLSSNNKRHI